MEKEEAPPSLPSSTVKRKRYIEWMDEGEGEGGREGRRK